MVKYFINKRKWVNTFFLILFVLSASFIPVGVVSLDINFVVGILCVIVLLVSFWLKGEDFSVKHIIKEED